MDLNMDHPESPRDFSSPGSDRDDQYSESEVPTEIIPVHEVQQHTSDIHRRQMFLSDFTQYHPVQNMNALADHVFNLSENIVHLRSQVKEDFGIIRDEFTTQKRMLGLVSDTVKDCNKYNRHIGEDVTSLKQDIDSLRSEMRMIREETQSSLQELKQLMMAIAMQGQQRA